MDLFRASWTLRPSLMPYSGAGPGAPHPALLLTPVDLGATEHRKREIRAGDVVVCPPGEKHWHGATATTAMSHIAIQEALDGKVVDWMEKVNDEEYLAAPASE